MTEELLDALVVGAGFGGVYQLKRLRDSGYNVKLLESGSDYGGVWYWNRYPGARVDSAIPHYEFSDPLLWKDWTWKERFPGGAELRDYFKYVANRWGLRKDTIFDCFVEKAAWQDEEKRWSITTKDGRKYKAKFFLLNTGFAAKRYIPHWDGVDDFRGIFLHPSHWPHEDLDLAGKRIAIIGTGATGVQLASELSKVASNLTVFQRTPNLALPMKQVQYNPPTQAIPRENYPDLYFNRKESFTGLSFSFLPRTTFADTPEQRRDVYEKLWAEGDFHFWLGTYVDMLFDHAANKEAYAFWREKVRARVKDPKMADLLAPMQQPHAFGCKRISLETDYFEIFNQDNVTLIDTSDAGTPVEAITTQGIRTRGGQEHDFDIIICATGYDAITGGLTNIDIRGHSGATLKQTWSTGVQTYLGMASHSFPNMFFTYGPQAPTSFCNGPTCAEYQGDWILQVMEHMRERGLEEVEVTEQSQKDWKAHIAELAGKTLLTEVDSWYVGANVPGKKREPLVYMGGVPSYLKTLADVESKGYQGFDFA